MPCAAPLDRPGAARTLTCKDLDEAKGGHLVNAAGEGEKPPESPGSVSGAVVRGALYLMIARVATLSVGLISMAILARLLSPADFGTMSIAFIVMFLPTVVYEGAFGLMLVQRLEIDAEFVRRTFWLSMIVALGAMALIIASAPAVEGFFGFPQLAAVLMAISVMMPLKAATSISQGLLRRAHRFGALATMNFFAGGIGNLAVAAPLAFMGLGPWALAIGAIVSGVLETAAGYALSRFPLAPPKRLRVDDGSMRMSLLFTLTQVLNFCAICTPNFIVGKFLGAAPLGFFSRAGRIVDIAIDGAAYPIQQTLISTFSRMQQDLERTRAAFERALGLVTLLVAALTAVMIVEAEPAVRFLLGPVWLSIVAPLQILFIGFAPRACYRLCESVAFGQGRGGRTAALQGFYLALMLAGALAGLAWGVVGVAIGMTAGLWLFYLATLAMAAQLVRSSVFRLLQMHARAFAVFLLIAGASWGVIALAASIGFWFSHVLGGFVALAIAAALFAFMGDDVAWARKRLSPAWMRLAARIRRSGPGSHN